MNKPRNLKQCKLEETNVYLKKICTLEQTHVYLMKAVYTNKDYRIKGLWYKPTYTWSNQCILDLNQCMFEETSVYLKNQCVLEQTNIYLRKPMYLNQYVLELTNVYIIYLNSPVYTKTDVYFIKPMYLNQCIFEETNVYLKNHYVGGHHGNLSVYIYILSQQREEWREQIQNVSLRKMLKRWCHLFIVIVIVFTLG